jgi:hypothetical protein
MAKQFLSTHTKNQSSLTLFTLFSWMWAIALLFHLAQGTGEYSVTIHHPQRLALFCCCLALLFRPSAAWLFLCAIILTLIDGWVTLPFVSNHWIVEILASLSFLAGYLHLALKRRTWTPDPEQWFQWIAPAGRWFLILMYFFGVFHKLNTDWFLPEISCAVALWKHYIIPLPEWLAKANWAHYSAIYGTLIIETAIIIVLLWFRRWSKWAILTGICFHGILIGLNKYAFYWNFSSLSFALHFLFLPEATGANWQNSRLYQMLCRPPYANCVSAGIGILFIGFAYGIHRGITGPIYLCWFVFTLGVAWFVYRFAVYPQSDAPGRRALFVSPSLAVNAVIALFFLNGVSPYIGLKTDSTIAMYSNLYTENGTTNHLLFNTPPYWFDYQNEVVVIKASSDPALRRLVRRKKPILLHQLQQKIHRRYPKAKRHSISYEMKGETYSYSRVEDDPLLQSSNYWSMKLLAFKALDFSHPKRCTH